MKVKVLKSFKDKYKKIVYSKGEIIDVTEGRFTEIVTNLGDGYVVAVPENNPSDGNTNEQPVKRKKTTKKAGD